MRDIRTYKQYMPPFLRIPLREIYYFLHKINSKFLAPVLFYANYKKRKQLRCIYSVCATKEDYLAFWKVISSCPMQAKEEIFDLLDYAIKYQPKCVVEIGTARCGVTFLLSNVLESVSLVIGIDVFVRDGFLLHYFSRPQQTIKLINSSSYAARSIEKVRDILGNKKVGLLFIDGDHSYEGVKKDFLRYRQFMAENGLIAFHDILPDYFTRYGMKTSVYSGGVPDFWNRIKQLYPSVEFVRDPEANGLGIGLITYSPHVMVPNNL